MTTRFAPPDRARPLWQTLLAPMLLASLGLHGLVLMLPAGSSGDAVIPPPDPEQDSVAITRVPPAGAPELEAAAAPTTTTPVPARQTAPAAVPQPQPQPRATVPRARSQPPQPQAQAQPRPQAQSQPQTQSGSAPQPVASSRPASPDSPASTAPASTAPDASSRPLFDGNLGEQLLAHVAALDLPQAQVDQAAESIQNRFAFNAAAVTREAFNTNQQRWEAAIRQDSDLADLSAEVNRTELSTVYPQRVCLTDVPGEINIGAVVNPDGSWRGEPTLLRSSGYGALDRKALQEIQNHTFPPADGPKAYVLTVETTVDYGPRPCLDPNSEA
ncbi:energy transducer TonB [Nodosilinea sp. LEGE 06152]|uniref:energy transducer TonB n=1 Tax=Nodosilinea sp. LEGE 06152 TaxID=2777966 RepID=UPI001880DB08|nr:energy transducer TonB [Nodosilinea sp. LEGE 06152]MBE9158747.1 energy transducer TonB [Nodosilinea sp. LEGE 06152]